LQIAEVFRRVIYQEIHFVISRYATGRNISTDIKTYKKINIKFINDNHASKATLPKYAVRRILLNNQKRLF
jgi:hypothetical protein